MSAPDLRTLIELGRPALLERYGRRLTAHQRRALDDMARCHTGALGTTAMACRNCDQLRFRHRACGHRSCPACQHHATADWLARQRAKLVPADYFMVTFTLPAELRPLAYRHPKQIYDALFATALSTLRTFTRNHPDLEAELGATAVLHTHTRRLDYHPHLHVVVPAAGVDSRQRWRRLVGGYLFNGRALARVFRARFLEALRRADLLPPAELPTRWVVQCQRVGSGLPALKYLSRYLYRGVLATKQIVAFDAATQRVTFRYQDSKTRTGALRTLELADFLWRLLVHVLPRGYRRVRDFGFLHGNAKRRRAIVQIALRVHIPVPPPRARAEFRCQACRSSLTALSQSAPPRSSG